MPFENIEKGRFLVLPSQQGEEPSPCPHFAQRLRWVTMLASVSPNCTSWAESSPRQSSSSLQARAFARAVIIAVETQGSIRITGSILCIHPPACHSERGNGFRVQSSEVQGSEFRVRSAGNLPADPHCTP